MKKVVIGMAIGVLVLAGSAGAALMNPGFETEGGNIGANWTSSTYGAGYVYGARESGGYSGYCLHTWLYMPGWGVGPSDYYATSDSFSVTPGSQYDLSTYTKMTGYGSGNIQLRITWDNGAGDSQFFYPGTDWEKVSISGTVPAGVTSAQIRLAGCFNYNWTGNCNAYFDEVSYTETPEPATMGLMILGGLFLRRRK